MEKIRSRIESSATFQQKLENLPINRFARSEKWSALLWTICQMLSRGCIRPSEGLLWLPKNFFKHCCCRCCIPSGSERLLREQLASSSGLLPFPVGVMLRVRKCNPEGPPTVQRSTSLSPPQVPGEKGTGPKTKSLAAYEIGYKQVGPTT